MKAAQRVSFGLRAHSGWAVLVALGGPPSAPVVVDRRRLSLCDGSFPWQPYHAAENLKAEKARALVGRSLETAHRLAREALLAAAEDRRAVGHTVAGAGLLLGSGRPLPADLSAILASHPLIHTAEGEMYREVLRAGLEHCAVPVVGFKEREARATGHEGLGLGKDQLRARLAALGKSLGPPWTEDEKLATVAAWLVLRGATG